MNRACVCVCVHEEEEKRQTVSIIGISHAVLQANVLYPHCSVDRGRNTLQNTLVCYWVDNENHQWHLPALHTGVEHWLVVSGVPYCF